MSRISILALCALLAACTDKSAPLTADILEVSLPRPGTDIGALYLRITNTSSDAITITTVSSPQFEAVEIHETDVTDGIARMRKLDSVTIPANSSVALERGSKHLMLIRPKGELDDVSITFSAGTAPVLAISLRQPE